MEVVCRFGDPILFNFVFIFIYVYVYKVWLRIIFMLRSFKRILRLNILGKSYVCLGKCLARVFDSLLLSSFIRL